MVNEHVVNLELEEKLNFYRNKCREYALYKVLSFVDSENMAVYFSYAGEDQESGYTFFNVFIIRDSIPYSLSTEFAFILNDEFLGRPYYEGEYENFIDCVASFQSKFDEYLDNYMPDFPVRFMFYYLP